MNKILLLIFLSLFNTLHLIAQNQQTVTILGKVIDSASNKPLEYATVVLKKENSNDVFGVITDKNGAFKLLVNKGTYSISFDFLSHQSFVFKKIELTKDKNFGNILLSVSSESLDAVEINGNSNLIDFKLGKKIYNVEKDISAQGATATDILENAPSVSVVDGIPMIRGNAATIMINGRISGMSKIEALQNLQASGIKKVEVITSPSSRFSANTSGGIINIILKKGLDNGLNGSVTGTIGHKDIYGSAANINYRKNKVNFYTNTSFFHRDPLAFSTIENEYMANGNTSGFLNETRINSRKNIVFNITLGADFYIDDYKTLRVEGSYGNYNGNFNNTNTTNYFDANYNLTKAIDQQFKTDHKDEIYDISLTYDQYFEKDGKAFFATISHQNDQELNNSSLLFNEFFPSQLPLPESDELIFDDLKLVNTKWQTYYVFPTSEKAILEFGSDGTLGNISTKYSNEVKENGDFIIDPSTSNILDYRENWVGFYSDFVHELGNFSYLLGLRTEFTDLTIDLKTTNEQSSQKYTDIFPSVQLEYILKEDKTLAFAYRRGIKRVDSSRLNPFEFRVSETTSYQGNLNLLPFYSNDLELSILNNSEAKFTINPAIYFRNYDNIWQEITIETGEIINGVPKLLTTPINLGYLNFAGIELLSSYKPSEKVEFNSTIDFRYVKQNGVYTYTNTNNDDIILDYNDSGFGGSIDLNTSIKLPFDIRFQSLIKYNIASEGAYSKRYAYAFMDASLSKDIFKNNATLSLNAKDIFNSRATKRLRWTDDVNSLSNFQWREPSIILSFTYRFNQSKRKNGINMNEKDIEIKY